MEHKNSWLLHSNVPSETCPLYVFPPAPRSALDYQMHVCLILTFCHLAFLQNKEGCEQHATVFCRSEVIHTGLNGWGKKIAGNRSASPLILLYFFSSGSEPCETQRFTSAHVAVVRFVARFAAAATDRHHPLSVPVTVELDGHVHFLSIGNTTPPRND